MYDLVIISNLKFQITEQFLHHPKPMLGRLKTARALGRRWVSTKNFVQEHDYTVTPTTYTYTVEGNEELFDRFPLVNAKSLARRNTRPKKARMLAREFIEDSMYNPHYGYFSQAAEIFSLQNRLEVEKMGNLDSFLDHWAVEYKRQQQIKTQQNQQAVSRKTSAVSEKIPADEQKNIRRTKVSRQLWHTPSELFTPYYGCALARHIIAQHMNESPADDLVIYETGAGNGTLMADILNFLKTEHPELYKRTHYNVIEISASLVLRQKAHSQGHNDHVTIHNRSIFDWNVVKKEPCFFVCLEVWDNLAHDVIRYDNTSGQPYQGFVVIDPNGDFTEVFSPKLDKWATELLDLRQKGGFKPRKELGWHPLSQPQAWRYAKNAILPFHGNLSPPEYIPSRYLQLLYTLRDFFPNHRLLGADFTHFTERISGYNSPVVQTFMEDTPVTVSTYMVLQGFFDIMFPTDFQLAKQLYEQVTGKQARVASHHDFLQKLSLPDKTSTKTGEDPMLSFYRNAAFLYTSADA